jgi:predicted dehydrogenase
LLAVGHQRHYSILYDGVVDVLQQGMLGDLRHIRALWHRNNSRPGRDSWDRWGHEEYNAKYGDLTDKERDEVAKELATKHGYRDLKELINWRLYQRTGGGLMAELGSHQIDACSIFLGKVHPVAVSGVGGTYFYHDDREVEDHVFCSYEFPGTAYWKDKDHTLVGNANDLVVVTYSSINTNGFEGYGECIMGTEGTLIVDSEKEALLFKERTKKGDGPPRSTHVKVGGIDKSGAVALDSSGTAPGGPTSVVQRALSGTGAVSKGYREELEHLAFCIRKLDDDFGAFDAVQAELRCSGEVALADAVIALTSNLAMNKQVRIPFRKKWFKVPAATETQWLEEPHVTDKDGDPYTDPDVAKILEAVEKGRTS